MYQSLIALALALPLASMVIAHRLLLVRLFKCARSHVPVLSCCGGYATILVQKREYPVAKLWLNRGYF
jgi:hypothetical protein